MKGFLEISDAADARYANAVLVALEALCEREVLTKTNEEGEEYYECPRCGQTDFLDVQHSESCLFSPLNDVPPAKAPSEGCLISYAEYGPSVVFDENWNREK